MNKKFIKLLKFFLGWPISLIALFFVFKIIGEKSLSIFPKIEGLNYPSLILGIFLIVLFFFIRGVVWNQLLKSEGIKISLRESSYIWGISELKRYTPGNIWSFISRTLSFNDKGIDKKTIGKLIFTEIQLFIISSLIVSLFSIPFALNSFFHLDNYGFNFLIYLFTALLFVIFILKQRYSYYKNALFLFLYVLSFILFGLGTYFAANSIMPLNLNLLILLSSFFVLSWLVGYLSIITPMGLGIREGIMTIGLAKVINIQFAGVIAIFTRVIMILSELVFVLLIVIWNRKKK
jgi:glycosyltransferase 2 family protein